jgi:hypothetical protein
VEIIRGGQDEGRRLGRGVVVSSRVWAQAGEGAGARDG